MAESPRPERAAAERDFRGHGVGRGIRWSWIFWITSRGATLVAVPILLDALGLELYGVWVMAGVLVGSQGLLDLGVGTALTRFAAVAGARGARGEAVVVLRRALIFYGGLSAVVTVFTIVFARELADLIPGVGPEAVADAARLFEYAAIAFALTNGILVLDGLLRGLSRVATSYAIQTLGWLAYVPALLIADGMTSAVDAAGIAWLVTFGIQLVSLVVVAVHAVRAMPADAGDPASLRAMLSLGARWQVSTWADLATFQLPRLLGGFLLGSAALVIVDLALRFAQLVVAPLLATYPVVLPAVTRIHARQGLAAVTGLVRRLHADAGPMLVTATAVAAPLSVPAITVWTGQELGFADGLAAGILLVGAVAWASTGLMTSALLAVGRVAPVVRYKTAQLCLAIALTFVGALVSAFALACAIALALLVPALVFDRTAQAALGASEPAERPVTPRALSVALVAAAIEAAVVSATVSSLSPAAALGISVVVGGLVLMASWRLVARAPWGAILQPATRVRRATGG